MKYVIEHMDPELWDWSDIEYRHISESVGKENLIITNLKPDEVPKANVYSDAYSKKTNDLKLKRVCILDPEAEKELSPEDADNFDYLVFGGILGNDPPEARTKDLKVDGAERRHLGKDQFSTDNAVMVSKLIIEGTPLEKLDFIHDLTIEMDEGEEIILPFKYLMYKGEPFISQDLLMYIEEHGF